MNIGIIGNEGKYEHNHRNEPRDKSIPQENQKRERNLQKQLDDQVKNISDLSRYSYMMIKFAEAFDGNVELNPGLQIVEYLEDGLKIRIDKQRLSEKEAMTELIDKMPVENISIEKQSLEDFIYNLVQK